MNESELYRILRHCHTALGDTLNVINEMLNQQGDPDAIIQTIDSARKKYNAITRLINELQTPSEKT